MKKGDGNTHVAAFVMMTVAAAAADTPDDTFSQRTVPCERRPRFLCALALKLCLYGKVYIGVLFSCSHLNGGGRWCAWRACALKMRSFTGAPNRKKICIAS